MHSDRIDITSPDMMPRGHRMKTAKQTDGHKAIPHLITGFLSIAASLVIAHFSPMLQGKPGADGTTTVITKTAPAYGICETYNSHASGSKRFSFTTPQSDKNGLWCKTGKLITILPGK